ncbi:hypothetical protein ACHAXT_000029 [Thalassiosira profunda]
MRSFLPVLFLLIDRPALVRAQPRLGVAVGNRPGGGGDVVRQERYEYHPPGQHIRRHQPGPFDGILPGIALTIASAALQWWNEGRAMRDARMLAAAKREVVELDSSAAIDPENDGRLVHVTGDVTTEKGLVDPEHGLQRPEALQLIRTTEGYQWKERRSESRTRVSERETKVTVEYSYYKNWVMRPIPSDQFQSPGTHNNPPPRYPLGRSKLTANDARLSNGLRLRPSLVEQIGNGDRMMQFASSDIFAQAHYPSDVVLGRGGDLPQISDAVISSNHLYFSESKRPLELERIGEGPSNNDHIPVVKAATRPEVGDVRVSWQEVTSPRDGVSILAQQQNEELVPWGHGDRGHNIYSLLVGEHTADAMIEHHIGRNRFITKLLRFGGWVGSFIGLNLILSCLPAIVKIVPFGIGDLLQPLASIAASTIAMGISVGLSGAVISVAWLRFRPLLAGGLALVSGAGFFGPLYYARWKRSTEVKAMDAVLK